MSFWDNMKKFTQPFADDDYDEEYDDEYDEEYEEEEAPAPRRERRRPAPAPVMDDEEEEEESFYPAPAAPVASAAPAAPAKGGFTGTILSRNAATAEKREVVLFRPVTFADTHKAADDLCENKAVIVNLESMDNDTSRRIVDVLSGCVYALKGKAKKIAQSTYLFCPPNMEIVGSLDALQVEPEAEAESYV